MVGPSYDEAERARLARRLAAAFVLTVAVSGALVAVYAGGGLPLIAAGGVSGAAVGLALAWYLSRIGGSTTGRRRRTQ